MNPLLKLTLGSLDVTYQGFIFEDGLLARRIDQELAGTVEYSAYGGVALNGSPFEPKFVWTFSVAALQDQALADQTRELYAEYQRLKRAGSDPRITLEDTTEYYFEAGPRTRALATSASQIVTTTGIKYHAKYYAYFERPPEFSIGEGFTVQLREGEVFPA